MRPRPIESDPAPQPARETGSPLRRRAIAAMFLAGLATAPSATARAAGPQGVAPNYKKANQFGGAELRPFVYDGAVNPTWIGKTDAFWYAFRTAEGTNYVRVNPKLGTKEPLFDRAKLAMALSESLQKPLDGATLAITRPSLDEAGTKFKFVVDDLQYEYDLAAETLAKLGKAPAPSLLGRFGPGGRRGEGDGNGTGNGTGTGTGNGNGENRDRDVNQVRTDGETQQGQQQTQQGTATAATPDEPNRRGPTDRAYSPDRKSYVFARKHNLYFAEVATPPKAEEKKAEEKKPEDKVKVDEKKADDKPKADEKAKVEEKTPDAKLKADDKKPEDKVTQLSTDGAEGFSFGGDDTDKMARPMGVVWSADSKAFHVSRRDSRNVKELYLVNSLATPRPTLEKYKYPLPGEEGIHATELFVFVPSRKALVKVPTKWKEEGYSNIQWGKTSDELRFVRTDRLVRHAELCSLTVSTAAVKPLIAEGFENAPLTIQAPRYLDETDEMVWWSERSGWGHFYLYTRDGTLKNAITSGPYRAGTITAIDPKNRRVYFTASSREPGENPNYNHLYAAQLDGTGLSLMDPGDANHRSSLSPSRQYLVDNASRVDKVPTAILRRADGTEVMPLEKADVSRLEAAGWKAPETFVVKAADGVTDLYGNLWKPFDFVPTRKYPIIVHVYPGPQQEGTIHAFSPLAGEQALAQIGFIVVQVGHRGGSPNRSKAYASYGYFNLRDYGLADKKAALEQLALTHPYIDIERVGIYGHSGGGFMTAAAMMQKPYNDFFKVGVSSSGNHDNNVYGAYWAERYHGLKEVEVKAADKEKDKASTASGTGTAATTDVSTGADDGAEFEAGSDDAFLGYGAIDGELPVMDGSTDDPQQAEQQGGEALKAKANQVAQAIKEVVKATKFDITVPTNAELAPNLKGRLLLVHGEMDNNVHPAGTMRLVDALIRANKRFDLLILPGKRHGYADYQPYFTQRMWEYFGEHLLGDSQVGADILEKSPPSAAR